MFDAAINSRVHLTMHYPPPNLDVRRQLWESHFNKIPDDGRELKTATALRLVIKYTLNGREISNIINSAITLAKSEGGQNAKLRQEHLEDVLEAWKASKPGKRQLIRRKVHDFIVDLMVPTLGILVLLMLLVVVSFHGYQVVLRGSRDILILYR